MRQSMVDGRYQICRGNHRHAIRKRRLVDSNLSCGGSRNASVGLVGVAKQDAERGMKVVNEYLANKNGLTADFKYTSDEKMLEVIAALKAAR